ncbi:hypothetical protein DPMN_040443 [Dreissena polymorpha]|uniref:Mab-21-like nucleotidyltransferase domain-containing protein n=2 Tax=Dreissena polymorpha TaxID=45954 RepID=A0A9D4HV74_DREPO|nr:hypothetical protein DPMN_040443 [Dreissena polymorpha]
MTRLGYGEEIRRWRVKAISESDRMENARRRVITIITTGSKAEGLTCGFESDWDILYVLNLVVCVETGIKLHTIPDDIDVFRMDTRVYPGSIPDDIGVFRMDTRVYPGYCILLQERQAPRGHKVIHDALCDDGHGGVLLSSALLIDNFEAGLISTMLQNKRAGPSLSLLMEGVLYTDNIITLRCYCPSILNRWATRRRHWPSQVIVQKVVSLGAYLTPVGFAGSEHKHIEWRICFNTGETELVNNLNSTQANVYVMLKMILNDILKPNNKEITSYMLKNIILWQAERNPQAKFHAHSLFYWLHDGLRELRTAIAQKQLAYYMIPDKNLMVARCLEDGMQSKWISDINDMMEEGPRVILRLPKIRKAIVASPEPMVWFSKKRMELEMLYLEYMKSSSGNDVVDQSNAILQEIQKRKNEVLNLKYENSTASVIIVVSITLTKLICSSYYLRYVGEGIGSSY